MNGSLLSHIGEDSSKGRVADDSIRKLAKCRISLFPECAINLTLPQQLTTGAVLRDKEYAWELSAFPLALEHARRTGYACLGGQFWIVLPDNSLYELFWLEANATDRQTDEPWQDFVERSCGEVLGSFNALVSQTDFVKEARSFTSLESLTVEDFPSKFRLLFNAYFVSEQEFFSLQLDTLSSLRNR